MGKHLCFFFGWGVGCGWEKEKKELEGGKDLLEGFFGDVGEGGWEVPTCVFLG